MSGIPGVGGLKYLPLILTKFAGIGVQSYGGNSFTPTFPVGVSPGDLLLTYCSFVNQNTVGTPSGWTLLTNHVFTYYSTSAIYYRIYQAGDVAPTYTWAEGFGTWYGSAICARYTGIKDASPFGAIGSWNTVAGGGSSFTSNGITTTKNNSFVVSAFFPAENDVNGVFAPATGWNTEFDILGYASEQNIAAYDKAFISSGTSSGNLTVTNSVAASDYASIQFEIVSASS